MENQEQTTIISKQQVPPGAVIQQARVIPRRTVNVYAVRIIGK